MTDRRKTIPPALVRYANGDLVCACDLIVYEEEFGCAECGANVTNIVPATPDVDADEFKCEACGAIMDNDDSIRVGDELHCPTCAASE